MTSTTVSTLICSANLTISNNSTFTVQGGAPSFINTLVVNGGSTLQASSNTLFTTGGSSAGALVAGTNATLESRELIDLPTAGILPAGDVAIDVEFFQESGFLTGVSIGALDRLTFGMSYGANGPAMAMPTGEPGKAPAS